MKLWLVGMTLVLAGLACSPAPDHKTANLTISYQGIERVYSYYHPGSSSDAGMVVYLHGGGNDIDTLWKRDTGQAFMALARRNGFVILMPQGAPDEKGLRPREGYHWNDCRADISNPAADSAADDVGFILYLIDLMIEEAGVDPARVYVTGASNGGMMTYRLLLEAPEVFAAGAAMIANLPAESDCDVAEGAGSVPLLILNGAADPLMPFGGGCVANQQCTNGTVLSSEATAADWAAVMGATGEPAVEALADANARDGSTITGYLYEVPGLGVGLRYYVAAGGGHIPPGPGRQALFTQWLFGPRNRDVEAAELIWGFFAEYGE